MKKLNHLSRRDFLKLSSFTAAGMAFERFRKPFEITALPSNAIQIVRVAAKEIHLYKEPNYESDELGSYTRDELIYVYEKVTSPYGPVRNPRWYKVDGGFVHTAYLQPVETSLNEVSYHIPETGQLAEVTVPMTLSFLKDPFVEWKPLYRLYYQSVHWVREIGYGPNGQAYYGIKDDLLPIVYYVPAHHLRLIQPEELTPINAEVPPEKKSLMVNRTRQTVTAFEDGEAIFHSDVSTGIPYNKPGNNGISTITPLGDFNVNIKMPVRHMGNGNITADIFEYELPGVPWVSFFYKTGVAFHGTYWHDNYGTEMSRGCVNMKPEDAKWLFRWVMPESSHSERVKGGFGTFVQVVV
ncbi:MAG: L,D-transpeptidase family protein [candidate division Zixibacteria bacterium]|nr:L,D-transpeptidase family protein [Gammaproteobacteria bacterium]NIX56129.1 L,D-transpeptidase family protein [candidate division Zixibacteria bacterium]